ncbi:MAG: DNA gyrase/topoisomerase IV subunit A [Bernardetiaceae bacterium]|nr:DNA gyrase/topoisomerase IV subunit A [Bernardetiaceae bacterium]
MEEQTNGKSPDNNIPEVTQVSGLYENWFLDYASYVILERAVPGIRDGLKPVQRRILHAMFEMHDGRYHKVANIIGQTMQYHPHGDASIGDALVNLGQKDLLIDTQGNWGDSRTGDSAAAARYIEARLSKFALDVLFNPQTTEWQRSYDGRKREPVQLPVKFPMLLAQGVEGIAVGLSTKIMPHNFNELIDASIDALKGKATKVYPDFPSGGFADFSQYEGGKRGGKIKVRARIEQMDKKTLIIREIPYFTTTDNLIDSILKANDAGKIKIKQVTDNTAEHIEILIELAAGISPDVTISALYAFTDCEMSVSPNACVIVEDKPLFLSVDEILKISTENTKELLKKELEIKQKELQEKIFFASLERLFIEKGIYKRIEDCETWEAVLKTIEDGLKPYAHTFYREITRDDILRLTEIKIKRISKYDTAKADDLLLQTQKNLEEVEHHLENLRDYAIAYFKELKNKYGADRQRKTQITSFDSIEATAVAANNAKLYVNKAEGFIGYGLKKEEFVCECSDIDDVIIFREDGTMKVVKIADKIFVGKDIIHVAVFQKGDERMVYNMAYLDGKSGRAFVKRFQVLAVTRDREYNLATDHKLSKVLYFSANPNGEAEVINVLLSNSSKARIKNYDYNFADLEIKGRTAKGNILSKYAIRRIKLAQEGESTLGGLDIWYDPAAGTLNKDKIGQYLGNFEHEDSILVFYKDGSYEQNGFALTNRYEFDKVLHIEKFDADKVVAAVHYEGQNKAYYLKRFKIETATIDKRFSFVSNNKQSKLLAVTTANDSQIEVYYKLGAKKQKIAYPTDKIEEVKGWKALGRKLEEPKIWDAKFILPEKTKPEEIQIKGSEEKALF